MREIKFRAWEGEKMEYGYIVWDWLCDLQELGSSEYKFMQYTGLNDKNGKEIYEGDILSIKSWIHFGSIDNTDIHTVSSKLLVEYKIPDPDNYFEKPSPYWSLREIRHDLAGNAEYEVIGNIYENPKLIK